MENDPWDDILGSPTPAEDRPSASEPEPLDQVRSSQDAPYTESSGATESAELGERYGSDEAFKAALQTAVFRVLQRKPAVAYNPGSGERATLAQAFPGTRVIFADTSAYVEQAFVRHNVRHPDERYEFFRANMHDFRLPENLRADVTLIVNAGYLTEDELDRVTALDGLVIVSSRHDAAEYILQRCPGYSLRTRLMFSRPENDLYVFQRRPDYHRHPS